MQVMIVMADFIHLLTSRKGRCICLVDSWVPDHCFYYRINERTHKFEFHSTRIKTPTKFIPNKLKYDSVNDAVVVGGSLWSAHFAIKLLYRLNNPEQFSNNCRIRLFIE